MSPLPPDGEAARWTVRASAEIRWFGAVLRPAGEASGRLLGGSSRGRRGVARPDGVRRGPGRVIVERDVGKHYPTGGARRGSAGLLEHGIGGPASRTPILDR